MYIPGTSPGGQFAGGVVPITQVPLHQYQRDALTGLGNVGHGGMLEQARTMATQQATDPQAFAQNYTASGTQTALDNMSGAAGNMGVSIGRGTQAFTGQDAEQYFNPYQQYITDKLTDEGAKARARLMGATGQRGGRGAFGSTAFGTALGELEEGINLNIGQSLAQGYQNAQGFAQAQKERELQGAQLYGNQGQLYGQRAGLGQDIFGTALGLGRSATSDMFNQANQYLTGRQSALGSRLDAGQYIRDFNQGQANQLTREIDRRVNMTPDRIGMLANTLGTVPRAGQSTTGQVRPSGLSQLGGVGMALGGLF